MSVEELNTLFDIYSSCKNCQLSVDRKNIVFGAGSLGKIMLIGEAPGEAEDADGYPFVGVSGQCLSKMLLEAGIEPLYSGQSISETTPLYITNMVMCRPSTIVNERRRDRAPSNIEIKACLPRLHEEIQIVDPIVIGVMGKVARMTLIKNKSIKPGDFGFVNIPYEVEVNGKMRKKSFGYPAYVFDHPSFVNRKGCSGNYINYKNNVATFKKLKLYYDMAHKLKEGIAPFDVTY